MATLKAFALQHIKAARAASQRIRIDAELGWLTPDSLQKDLKILAYHRLAVHSFRAAVELERRWNLIIPFTDLWSQNVRSNQRMVPSDGDRISCARVAAIHESIGKLRIQCA